MAILEWSLLISFSSHNGKWPGLAGYLFLENTLFFPIYSFLNILKGYVIVLFLVLIGISWSLLREEGRRKNRLCEKKRGNWGERFPPTPEGDFCTETGGKTRLRHPPITLISPREWCSFFSVRKKRGNVIEKTLLAPSPYPHMCIWCVVV